jgi:hypothetical protein
MLQGLEIRYGKKIWHAEIPKEVRKSSRSAEKYHDKDEKHPQLLAQQTSTQNWGFSPATLAVYSNISAHVSYSNRFSYFP